MKKHDCKSCKKKKHCDCKKECSPCQTNDCAPLCPCEKPCNETGRCCIRRQNYFVNACPENRHSHHKNPAKNKDPVRLYVQDYGDINDPVILCPDGTLSPEHFQYQITPLVEAGFRVVIVTPRGFGKSDKPYGPYNMDVWADDLHSVIKQLDLNVNTLVGSTPQSRISLRYITRHGCDRVERLYFHSPNALAAPHFALDPVIAAMEANREDTLNGLTLNVFSPIVPSTARLTWALQREFDIPLRVWVAILESFFEDMTPELKCVCAPLLGIVGDQDFFTPVPVAQAFVDGVPKGKLIVVPGQGHAVQIVDAPSYNDPLIAFAKSCDPCTFVKNFIPPVPPEPVPG